jgi:hypothetical protein
MLKVRSTTTCWRTSSSSRHQGMPASRILSKRSRSHSKERVGDLRRDRPALPGVDQMAEADRPEAEGILIGV